MVYYFALYWIFVAANLLSSAVHKLLIAVASLVVERGLRGARASVAAAHGLSSCSSWALEHRLDRCGTKG